MTSGWVMVVEDEHTGGGGKFWQRFIRGEEIKAAGSDSRISLMDIG